MGTKTIFSLSFITAASAFAMPLQAQDGSNWDRARGTLISSQPGQMAPVINRWERLIGSDRLSFSEYASFLITYPGFPQEERLRQRAEAALERDAVTPQSLVAYFDRHPPLTNPGRARHALALATLGRPEAFEVARAAWRGGSMNSASEAYMQGMFGTRFSVSDHDARMDALLWQADAEGAARQIARVSPAMRATAMARLALLQGQSPEQAGLAVPATALNDPGYVYNRARYLRSSGQIPQAVNLLATRPQFATPAHDAEDYIGVALAVAKSAGADPAARIASKVDDLFAPGADVSTMAYKLRDDYTSLMWLGGTQALWSLGDGNRAAPLFYRYGAAAQTPPTRSKGFYWAGLASQRAGNAAEAARYFAMAAEYPERFYGQLALKELGRTFPQIASSSLFVPTAAQRAEFAGKPLVAAVTEVARGAPWRTGIQFYREIAEQAKTPEEHALVAELARQIGRRDLAVILGESAGADAVDGFVVQGFPVMPVPPGADWTMVHAITRQESQFAQNAISHAGARGLMQLMPGTAREQAGKLGMSYLQANLIENPTYNIQLGNSYFARMMDYYGGAYPLAVAAYNAGPGNVNKWLRSNGDPRQGSIDYVTWIERIPIYETKNYVQRVIENAATYEQLNPGKARAGRPRMAHEFLRSY